MTWRHLRTGLFLAVLLLTVSSLASAQTLTSGMLDGVVEDSLGTPLHDARVTVVEPTSGFSRSAVSGRDGRFSISLLPPSDYELLVERFGFRPVRMLGVPVRAGQRLTIPVAVAVADDRVDEAEVVRFAASPVAGTRAGASQWFSQLELAELPHARRELTELGRLSSVSNSELETEGLPSRLSSIVVDGIPVSPARHPDLGSGPLQAAAFPLSVFENAELITNSADVEWSGYGGGILSGYTRRGTREFEVRGFGAWSGDALFSSKYFDPGTASSTNLLGAFLVSGPIKRDTAAFIVGVEARRFETPMPQLWNTAALEPEVVRIALDSFGIDLAGYGQPQTARTEAISAFGRVDWQMAAAHGLSVRANFATVPAASPASRLSPAFHFTPAFEGSDISTAATLTSQLDRDLDNELRIGFESSTRDYGPDIQTEVNGEFGVGVPSTFLINDNIAFGSSGVLPGRFRHSAFRLSETLYYRTGAHYLKGGLGLTLSSYEQTYTYGTTGEFFFSSASDLARGRGSLVQVVSPVPTASFNVPQVAAYIQDTWSAAPGVELLLGARIEREHRPRDELTRNEGVFVLTGLKSDSIDGTRIKFSPRASFTWDVQQRHEWIVRAAAGVYHDVIDPGVFTELITSGPQIEVQRRLGPLPSYPTVPPPGNEFGLAYRSTLLGPNFDAPRTGRVSVGISRLIGSLAAVHVSATLRRTDFLPRRDNLNLLSSPSAVDQYGRPLYGSLVQEGALLAARPESERLFRRFDVLSAINADGRSDYAGITVGAERRLASALNFFGQYTYSQTTDNWLSGRGEGLDAQLSPFPDSINGVDWVDGRSDFDVPHRLVVGGEARVPLPLSPTVSALYRYRSGYPFTPGFRVGVDANADGSARNDPAFVDPSIAGTSELIAEWDCLGQHTGRFAARNACREPGVHTLDLRLGLNLLRADQYSAELLVDALNMLESDVGYRDAALYLVDPSRTLTRNDDTGSITVPLIANPNFGELLVRRTPGRILRLGLRVNF